MDGAIIKFGTIAPLVEWYVTFAGDPSRFQSLMNRIREVLGDVKGKRLALSTVTNAIEIAYTSELRRLIEGEVLSPFGLTRDQFVQKGKKYLGEGRFQEVFDRIDRMDLGVELLVAGLDGYAQTQLFSVSVRGVISPAPVPYHAIGAGAFAALGTLYPLAHFPMAPMIGEAVYRACAAKFAAENVPSVGSETHAMIVSPISHTWTLVTEVERLREVWKTKGQPPFPSEARRSIERDLRSLSRAQDYALKPRPKEARKKRC